VAEQAKKATSRTETGRVRAPRARTAPAAGETPRRGHRASLATTTTTAERDGRRGRAPRPAGTEQVPAPALPVRRRRRAKGEPGNVFGADPHKRTLTATVLDCRGGVLGTRVFHVSGHGHREMEAWATSFGPIERWAIEGASGLGRHTAMYLTRAGHDVRDCSPNRTNERRRARQGGKTGAEGSLRIAREALADPKMPVAFKRAGGDAGPDETTELTGLWDGARRSLLKSRQHLLKRGRDAALRAPRRGPLPAPRRERRPPAPQGPRCPGARPHRSRHGAPPEAAPRVRPLRGRARRPRERGHGRARQARAPRGLNPLGPVCIASRSEAELLVEVGDPRRFAGEGGFARFNGTAPLPASSGEGDGEPKRHRLNRGGNRRVNAVLYRMAITQLRCAPRAQKIFEDARARGHTKKEAIRVLKRHLSDVVYRRMMHDLEAHQAKTETTERSRKAA
jgi:transposase